MDKNTDLEKLLGLPIGSTRNGEKDLNNTIARGIARKTKELVDEDSKLSGAERLHTTELVKYGYTKEGIEEGKALVMEQATQTIDIARALVDKFMDEILGQYSPGDKLYTAGAKLVDSLTNSISSLSAIVLKMEQQEQKKKELELKEQEKKEIETRADGTKVASMGPKEWLDFVRGVQNNEINVAVKELPAAEEESTEESTEEETSEEE